MLLALSVISSQGAGLGPTAYKVFDERGGSIGRLENNDWTLPDPEKFVSTRHAQVRWFSGAYYLDDTSTNGTFVNTLEQRVTAEAPACLHDGDRIYIGSYEILVQLIEQRAANAPMPARPEPAHSSDTAQTWRLSALSGDEIRPAHGPHDLLIALGLDPEKVDANVYQQVGVVLKIVTQGLIDVLQSRAEVKSRFRMPMTYIKPVENNPLKFSLSAQDALRSLLINRNAGYMPATDAFREALADVSYHQLAMLAGVRAAFKSMLASLHPDKLEAQFERRLRRTSFVRLAFRLRFWGMYRAQFEDFDNDPEAHFQLLFGEEFARAYEEQLQTLASGARPERK